ncbi:thiolase family protein [Tuberibacillus sp. Marseille-P3662]|uniref:thiolase family protein n=1 Tax=Tuberibacillus sp. Marseille-P3662 TaxID=1965358 RepID=UPI000A1C9489|nr:thiolase family protein [Tuberibacillus sp. Marseille-P3662]
MNRPVIVQALRTPIGRANGRLKSIAPETLAAKVLKALINKAKVVPEAIDDVILGNVVGPGGNMARLASLTAGFPYKVPGVTIDRQCGSGLEAIVYAMRCIQAGAGDLYVAGGVESVSQAPWKMARPQSIHQVQPPQFYVRAPFAPAQIGDPDMGQAAENVAQHYNITREDQDAYAMNSHEKATHSIKTGRFNNEMIAVSTHDHNDLMVDECPRSGSLYRLFRRLPPLFADNGQQGTVTAGNACPMNDGASAVLMMSEAKAKAFGLQPMAEVVDAVSIGVDPNLPGMGPVPAVTELLNRHQLTIEAIDRFELNEAFASQVLASLRLLHIPEYKVNRGGGAIALGHPYGASGGVIMTRLVHELIMEDQQYGVATMGIGGGIGTAVLVKRVQTQDPSIH